jgi:cytoskeleton protein RodZ
MDENDSVLGLATIRKNRGVTLEEISNVTKISVRNLEAIERGDFGKLPGGIYDTNYIRQYARAIDYDEGAILALYRRFREGKGAQDANRGLWGNLRPASGILG